MDVEFYVDKYQLNNSEAEIIRYMKRNKNILKNKGVRDVAKETFVSTASIVNLAKKIGFTGYSELVFSLTSPSPVQFENRNIEIKKTQLFINFIKKYKNKKIMIVGSGHSQNIVNYMSDYFNLNGFCALSNVHIDFLRKNYNEEILIIIISSSGDTMRLLKLAEKAKTNQIELITFSGNRDAKLKEKSTLFIHIESNSIRNFDTHIPNLFFGNMLIQFEIMMSTYFNDKLS